MCIYSPKFNCVLRPPFCYGLPQPFYWWFPFNVKGNRQKLPNDWRPFYWRPLALGGIYHLQWPYFWGPEWILMIKGYTAQRPCSKCRTTGSHIAGDHWLWEGLVLLGSHNFGVHGKIKQSWDITAMEQYRYKIKAMLGLATCSEPCDTLKIS